MQIVLDSEVLPDIQMGPRREEPPTEIPIVIPQTDSECEIIELLMRFLPKMTQG